MKTSLISLKVKDTTPISWSKALASYFKKNYASQWSQFYNGSKLKELDQLRTNANSDLAGEALLEQNLLYYAYIEHIYLRIGSKSSQLDLEFTWYDAEYLGKSAEKFKQSTLVFEKSSILYNIGVILSQIANEKCKLDYKEAVPYLSKAASCFHYMSETFLNSPSIDLQTECTKFLAELMHAQAQELFLLKAINAPEVGKRASLISRLAVSCYMLYEKVDESYQALSGEGMQGFKYGECTWRTNIQSKVCFYEALAAYHYAVSIANPGSIGTAVAYLSKALESTGQLSKWYSSTLQLPYQTTKSMIVDKLKALSKDNDYIYHETVPEDVSLQVIKPMDAIKLVPFESVMGPYVDSISEVCDEIFKGLVPPDIYEKESIYSEQKAELLRREINLVEVADSEYASFSEFMNLPKLFQELEHKITYINDTKDDPQIIFMREQLRTWTDTIQNSELKDIDKVHDEILRKRQSIMQKLNACTSIGLDNQVKIKSSLVQASYSDDKLFSMIQQFKPSIELLKEPSKLWGKFNSFIKPNEDVNLLDFDDTQKDEMILKLKQVKEQYNNLKLLKEERSVCIKDLKDRVAIDDITKVLLLNHNKSESRLHTIFEEELQKFNPINTRIEATIFKQANLINGIKESLNEIFKVTEVENKTSSNTGNVLEERRNFFESIQNAVNSFALFSTDLRKGLDFYHQLVNLINDLERANSNGETPVHAAESSLGRVSLDEKLANLNLNSTGKTAYKNNAANPSDSFINGSNPLMAGPNSSTKPSGPPVPPKKPRPNAKNSFQSTNESFEKNPTSFYNSPSVFNESMYSKYDQ